MDLLLWQNLMFLLPLLLAVIYLLVLGLGGDGHEHDVSVHHEVGVHHDAGHDQDVDLGPSGIAKALNAFGLGRVPFSVLVVTVLILWGGTGLLCSQSFGIPKVGLSALIAGAVTLVCTPLIARAVGAFISTRSFHVRREALVGMKAKAIYGISETIGEVRLVDPTGNLRDLPARIKRGAAEIAEGTEVTLLRYDEQQEVFTVEKAQA